MLDGSHTIAAIFMEPIVGTNGIIIPTKEYMQGVRQLCDENGILLVIDETMGGWGRSGKWFAIENFDVHSAQTQQLNHTVAGHNEFLRMGPGG